MQEDAGHRPWSPTGGSRDARRAEASARKLWKHPPGSFRFRPEASVRRRRAEASGRRPPMGDALRPGPAVLFRGASSLASTKSFFPPPYLLATRCVLDQQGIAHGAQRAGAGPRGLRGRGSWPMEMETRGSPMQTNLHTGPGFNDHVIAIRPRTFLYGGVAFLYRVDDDVTSIEVTIGDDVWHPSTTSLSSSRDATPAEVSSSRDDRWQ
jgi:hypothetical protein